MTSRRRQGMVVNIHSFQAPDGRLHRKGTIQWCWLELTVGEQASQLQSLHVIKTNFSLHLRRHTQPISREGHQALFSWKSSYFQTLLAILPLVVFRPPRQDTWAISWNPLRPFSCSLSTRSPCVNSLSRRAQSGRWSSFGKRVWFTESHTVLIISFYLLFYLLNLLLIKWTKGVLYQVKQLNHILLK